ncbi:transcription factor GTE4 isoform X1 [Nymphaea colorata]|nr:transcription factor GTE4 isoform X1 [Nymphaea colorata]XP_031472724.1 transcription factor GTE4 isoform X1 [Nymphaea colorata]
MASGALIGGDDNSNKNNNNTVTNNNNNGGGGNNGSSRHRWGESKVYMRKGSSKSLKAAPSQTLTEEANSSLHAGRFDAASDDSSSLSRKPAPMNREPTPNGVSRSTTTGGGGAGGSSSGGFLRSENRVTINLTSKSKQEMRELRRKLTSELEQVRSLFNRLESRELQLRGYSAGAAVDNSGYSPPQVSGNGVKKTNSEVASIGGAPLRQLSIPVVENSQVGSDLVEKEKRTPKANQYYRNSDFVLGKDKFPPPESSSKKAKANGSVGSRQQDYPVDKGTSQAFKHCSAVLAKLMKHKHSWVFNTPVDVKGLGLHDYYSIIKHPMDLGTVKSRLNSNWYSSPTEFAEDVRLTFRNAMTYNPKGHDVHFMAEQLLKIFEDRWRILEAELVDDRLNSRFAEVEPDGVYSQVTKRGPPALAAAPPPPEPRKVLDRSESTTVPSEPKSKPGNAPSVRTPAPKKPKAKDPHKRDMTYEEKQKLSMNLQNLPSEKLDNIVQIIKKRNSSLCQHDDEIEVDIDSVDAETLWELDRFVTNYKKSLSKNRKKAELANQARAVSEHMPVEKVQAPPVQETPTLNSSRGVVAEEKNIPSTPAVESKKQGGDASRSSSSSSSSSDSGSSSSDSDSESSSAFGSDAAHSPRT